MRGTPALRRSILRPWLAALLLGLAGCITPRGLVEQRWLEVRSANFSIYTTLPEPEARALLEDLELFRATVSIVSSIQRQEPRVPTEIYALSASEFGPFQPRRNVAGFFQPGLRSNRVVIQTGGALEARAILYHEYTHFLIRNHDRLLYPRWFDEGFAELMSTLRSQGEWIDIGTLPEGRADSFRYLARIPFSRMIRARDISRWPERDVAMFYAQSWLLVHYLMYGQVREEGPFPPRMTRYLALLEKGVDEEEAFVDAFGMSFRVLEQRIEDYARRLYSQRLRRGSLASEFETRVRTLAPDEIAVRLGWLALSLGNLEFSQALFEQAAEANAGNSRAFAGIGDAHKFSGRYEQAEVAYRRALELEPRNYENHLEVGEYWLQRAQAETADRDMRLAKAREHLGEAIALAPAIPESHTMLGSTYLTDDQPPEPGIAPLERALELLPSHPSIHLPLAMLYHRTGRDQPAIGLLRRVLQWSQNPREIELAASLLETLQGPGSRGPD